MAKWRAIKDFVNVINNSNKDPFKLKEVIKCLCECELLLRFRLPYKH